MPRWLRLPPIRCTPTAADVGGNNIPVTGGAYNPDGLTVADVLSTAGAAAAVAAAPAAAAPVAGMPASAPAIQTAAAAPPASAPAPDQAPPCAMSATDFHQGQFDVAHHFHHLWG